MDIFSATAAVLRRWYVALPILLLTAYLAVQQYQSAQPTYTASASTILLPPPPQPSTPSITDPEDLQTPLDPALGSLRSASRLVAELVATNLENPLVRERLEAQGATAVYEVDSDGDSPLLDYSVIGQDPDVTARTLDALLAESQTVLAEVQQTLGAQTEAVYRLQLAAPVLAPLEVAPERNRSLIATLVGGGALAYFLALLVDAGLAARRRHRMEGSPPAEPTPRPRSGSSAAASTSTPPSSSATFRRLPHDRFRGERVPDHADPPDKAGSSVTRRD